MKSTLSELQRAIKGLVVMSSELESMFLSFLNNQVPTLWAAVAYPSLKPLTSWVLDFHKRISFLRSWIKNGEPRCFWLPGFFFPQVHFSWYSISNFIILITLRVFNITIYCTFIWSIHQGSQMGYLQCVYTRIWYYIKMTLCVIANSHWASKLKACSKVSWL